MTDFINILTSRGGVEIFGMFLSSAAKAALLIALAAAICAAFRRLSAAARHLILTCALCGSLLLPFLSSLGIYEITLLPAAAAAYEAANSNELEAADKSFEMPQHTFASPPARNTGSAASASERSAFRYLNSASLAVTVLTVWFAGTALLLFRLLIGLIATASLLRRSSEFKNPSIGELFSSLLDELDLKGAIRLRRSERISMPIVCGILRPAVVLPASAEEWSAERLRLVLLHELAHVARRDCLTQIPAQMACAFYWFNPLVWRAARRARIEREKACDERVIRIGAKPSDYAAHLLDIARSMQERRSILDWTAEASVAMARRSQLENRLLAILSRRNELGGTFSSPVLSAGLVALIAVALVSLAAIRPTASNARHSESVRLAAGVEKNRFEALPALAHEQATEDARSDLRATARPKIAAAQSSQTPRSAASEESRIVQAAVATDEKERNSPAQAQDDPKDFAEEMTDAGYANLSVDELVKLKSAGVTANYIKSLRQINSVDFTIEEIASLSGYGVTPKFILEARRRLGNPSVKEIVSLKRNIVKNTLPLPPPPAATAPAPENPPRPKS